MMANLHTPERLLDETQEHYRDRRSLSNAWESMELPRFVPGVRFPQRFNSERNAVRKAIAVAGGIRQAKRLRRRRRAQRMEAESAR